MLFRELNKGVQYEWGKNRQKTVLTSLKLIKSFFISVVFKNLESFFKGIVFLLGAQKIACFPIVGVNF